MGEIGNLPPADRIPPTRPTGGSSSGNQAPKRKPATGDRHPDRQRRRKQGDDDVAHVDEYA
jgi:hypothetical protein